jgi:HEPN domain-containing protein
MDRQEELRQWFEKADYDLMAAEYLITMHYPRPDEIICFHCQQAAEKYLKGFLFKNNIEPPKIHDLMKLLDMCETVLAAFNALVKQCVFLNRFSVTPRYPDEIQISADEVKTALRYANEVKDFVLRTDIWN